MLDVTLKAEDGLEFNETNREREFRKIALQSTNCGLFKMTSCLHRFAVNNGVERF